MVCEVLSIRYRLAAQTSTHQGFGSSYWPSTCVDAQATLTPNVYFLESNDIRIDVFEFLDNLFKLVTTLYVPLHVLTPQSKLSCWQHLRFAQCIVTCKILIPSVGLVVSGEALKSSCTKSPGFGRAMPA